jgi:ABC-2 type transport system permease protein
MTIFATIVEVTLRALLGRRRTVLLVLLAGLPVLVAALARIGGSVPGEAPLFDATVRTVLPLVALVFGTSALGSELEDGTATYVLAKPIGRWQVILAKAGVAGSLTGGLVVASTLASSILGGGLSGGTLATAISFAAAAAIAAFAYVALFVAASVFTNRALILGLIYTLVWEGALAGILEGTRQFSIREATLALAAALAPAGSGLEGGLELGGAVALLVLVIVGGLALATWRLTRWEVRGSD